MKISWLMGYQPAGFDVLSRISLLLPPAAPKKAQTASGLFIVPGLRFPGAFCTLVCTLPTAALIKALLLLPLAAQRFYSHSLQGLAS